MLNVAHPQGIDDSGNTCPPSRASPAWSRNIAVLMLVVTLLLALFIRDAADLIDLWWNSSTFSHCLLLPPVIGWLVWMRRGELVKITPRGWWPGLLWLALGAAVWMIGDAASVALFRQLGLIMMVQACVPTLLGPQVARGLLFPLFFMMFLVPFGEELVPPMQTLTADMAMVLLRLAGIPAHIDGIFITTPAGYFAVAEACSGVKFLVAMAALSVLTTHLCFTGWRRRAAFLAFAMTVPVFANGLRAFSTIWIAERYGIAFAAGADHVIYGWVFFGLVIALIGLISRPWFDRDPADVMIDGAALAQSQPGRFAPLVAAATAAIAIALMPIAWTAFTAAQAQPLTTITYAPPGGWTVVPETVAAVDNWRPRYDGADRLFAIRVTDARGAIINIVVAGYATQGEGRELVGFGQGAADPDGDWRWGQNLAGIGPARVDRISANGRARDALTVYIVRGAVTSSAARVKLLTLRARLLGGDQRAYAVILSAPTLSGYSGRDQIAALVTAAGGVEPLVLGLTQSR